MDINEIVMYLIFMDGLRFIREVPVELQILKIHFIIFKKYPVYYY